MPAFFRFALTTAAVKSLSKNFRDDPLVPVFDAKLEELDEGRGIRHRLFAGDSPMSRRYFIDQLSCETTFRQEFNALLASSIFAAYRFETPVLNSNSMDKPFEFVLINAPGLCRQTTDPHTFAQYFTCEEPVAKFKSLGADATLIAPSPISSDQNCYKHLASFVRNAPSEQIDALWGLVGQSLQNNTGQVWFNTEGSGVAWLHIRLDTRPKYYGHAPYRTAAGSGV